MNKHAEAGRLAPLARDDMTPEQRAIADKLLASPTGAIVGPMNAWLRAPAYADLIQAVGMYCRHGSTLPKRISELAILVAARHWSSTVEWGHHQPEAVKAGLDPAIADAIAQRARPVFDRADEEAAYDLCAVLAGTKAVPDDVYDRALAAFGEAQLVELIGVFGHYHTVAMVLKTFRVPHEGGPRLAD